MEAAVTRHIAAPPEQVWEVVSDVTRTPEFSPETFEVEWLGDADGPALGARFRGHVKRNERGPTYWSHCRVTACEPRREFAFDVLGPGGTVLNTWRYVLEPSGDGTDVTESFRVGEVPGMSLYTQTVGRLRTRYNKRNMATTLERMAAVIEGREPPPQTAKGPNRPMTVSDSVEIEASPQAVYEMIADPTRIAEWSPENTGAETPQDGVLQPGDRFKGSNTRGPFSWWTEAEVLAAAPPNRFTFRVDRWGTHALMTPVPVATWDYKISSLPSGGVRLTQTWTDDRDGWSDLAAGAFDKVATGTTFAQFQEGNIRRSLARLKDLLEG